MVHEVVRLADQGYEKFLRFLRRPWPILNDGIRVECLVKIPPMISPVVSVGHESEISFPSRPATKSVTKNRLNDIYNIQFEQHDLIDSTMFVTTSFSKEQTKFSPVGIYI